MSDIQNILRNGCDQLISTAGQSGAKFEFHPDNKDGVLDDDSVILSFTTSIKATEFNSDGGLITPKPVTFELIYNRAEDDFAMIISEDDECSITYGNVMAFMYFYEITR